MTNFIKYPSIGKFKDLVTSVNKMNPRTFSHLEISEDGVKTPIFSGATLPTLKFKGTIKCHGTNACVVINSDFTVDAQSRTRILSLTSDNHGFCSWLVGKSEVFLKAYDDIINRIDVFSLHLFGEWCGGNIQSNVGLTGIEKTFIIFGILQTNVDSTEQWLTPEEINYLSDAENNIRNIFEFPTYDIEIDMNTPEDGLAKANLLRDEIDKVCPVAKAMGSDAEVVHGEGNVWRCVTEGYTGLAFKHKGESHQRSGKAPKSQKISEPLTEEQQLAFDSFLKEAVTVDRLAQGIEFLKENNLDVTQKHTGVYLKWFSADVQKECKGELTTLVKTGVEWEQVVKPLSQMAREFLFSEIDKV